MRSIINISFEENSEISHLGNYCTTNSFCGKFHFNSNTDSSQSLIDLFNEAQRKYSRMHFGDPATRFEKSWTGYIGESCVAQILKTKLNLAIDETEVKLDKNGYDGGDIHFIQNSRRYTVNVSSRKLSLKDDIINVILRPDQYFVLIPVDQIDQYINRANLAFFAFIKFNSDSLIKAEIEGISIELYSSGEFIIPGFLMSSDILYLKNSGNLLKSSKGSVLKGLYGDMNYSVPMYTDNYVIFSSYLRKFRKTQK